MPSLANMRTKAKEAGLMKLDRLIGILSILLQRDKVTSQELAEKFEVSRRTILRDIESINVAGIPIVSEQGQGGGISIMDGYKIDRTLLSSGDMQAILSGLRSLDSHFRLRILLRYQAAGHSLRITSVIRA